MHVCALWLYIVASNIITATASFIFSHLNCLILTYSISGMAEYWKYRLSHLDWSRSITPLTCDNCMLNHCLEWSKWVLTNFDHDSSGLILGYTTADIHCRDTLYEWGNGITVSDHQSENSYVKIWLTITVWRQCCRPFLLKMKARYTVHSRELCIACMLF